MARDRPRHAVSRAGLPLEAVGALVAADVSAYQTSRFGYLSRRAVE